MAKYENLVKFIIDNVGGKENVDNVTHCLTRLRFKLNDESKVNEEALKNHKEIITAQPSGGKYQVVIGTHVGDVYEELLVQLGGKNEEKEIKEDGSLLNKFTSLITQIILPALGFLCASALISALSNILTVAGLIQTGDGAQLLLNAMGNAALTFFPIALGYTSAKAFKMDPFMGMLLGCILVFPGLTESINSGDVIYTLFEGTGFAMPVYKTFFGLPIFFPSTGYTSTVIPIIFATFFASKVEKFFKKILPAATRSMVLGFFTVSIGAIVTFLVVGPISVLLNNVIGTAIGFLFEKSALLALVVITLIYQPLVIFGLHWPLITVGLINFAAVGSDIIIASIFPASFAHLAACLAVYLRTKSQNLKNVALPAVVSACFCIIEPSFYGVTLTVKKRFGYCMLAGLAGGLILGLTNSKMYAVTMGVLGFPAFIDPNTGSLTGMYICFAAIAVTMIIAFALTWITYKPGEDGYDDDAEVSPSSSK